MAGVRLPAGVREDVLAHARAEAPRECCGLLIGRGLEIEGCVRAANLDDSPETRYLLDPAAHIAANRQLRRTGRQVIGSYHSHPRTPPVPSGTDLAEAYYPEFIWLIVSLAPPGDGQLAAWRLEAGRAVPLELIPAP